MALVRFSQLWPGPEEVPDEDCAPGAAAPPLPEEDVSSSDIVCACRGGPSVRGVTADNL